MPPSLTIRETSAGIAISSFGSDENDQPVLIGSTGAFRWPNDRESAEIGYTIIPEFRLKGYASEAVQAMITWIEATGKLTGLTAHTYPELTGSIHILEDCGFTLEGPGAEPRTIRYIRQL